MMEEQGDLNCNKITIQSSSEVYVHRFTTVFSCTSTQSSLSWQGPPIYSSLDVDNVLLQSDLDGACDGDLLWVRLNYFPALAASALLVVRLRTELF